MVFARKVWRLLVAIKDGLALALLLGFFVLLYGVMTARPSAGVVRSGALLLQLDGSVVEEPAAIDPIQELIAGEAPLREYRARDVVHALNRAAADDRIKAVVLDMSRFTGGGLVHLQEIGAALDAVRRARKPVLAYAQVYADDAMLLGAHASEVWVDPMGGAVVMGPGGSRLYYAGLLERLKITAHVFRVGTYKSAVEPFILDRQSPASREANEAVYGALWQAWRADVAKARPKADIARVTSDPAAWVRASGGDMARAALAAGLVDRIGNRVQFGERVAKIAGESPVDKRPGAFAHTALRTWIGANPLPRHGKAIGVVTIAGEIVDGEAGPGTAGGDRIAELLDKALDDKFAALVVRVDSPGGSVFASERIREAILRQKARRIPVVVSMGNLAASGGYWITTPADRIFAEPATLTGSIGVFAVVPTFEKTLADYGVTTDGVRTTALSGQPDLIGGLSPQVSDLLQANVEGAYARFLSLVAAARHKTPQQIDAVAQGRVWDGGTARQLGLVDEFGGLDSALAYAAKAAKLDGDDWHAEFLGQDTSPYATLLEKLVGGDDDSAPPAEARDIAALIGARQKLLVGQALADAERLVGGKGAQAFCLECPVTGAPSARETKALSLPRLLAKALGWD